MNWSFNWFFSPINELILASMAGPSDEGKACICFRTEFQQSIWRMNGKRWKRLSFSTFATLYILISLCLLASYKSSSGNIFNHLRRVRKTLFIGILNVRNLAPRPIDYVVITFICEFKNTLRTFQWNPNIDNCI